MGFKQKIERTTNRGGGTTVPLLWHGGSATVVPFRLFLLFFVILSRLRSFLRRLLDLKLFPVKHK